MPTSVRPRPWRAAVALACCCLLPAVTACSDATGGGAADGSTTAASPTTTTAQSPSPTSAASSTSPTSSPERLTRAQAAQRYLEITKPYNVAIEDFEAAFNSGAPLAELQQLARAVADALLQEATQLEQTAWPTNVAEPTSHLAGVDRDAHGQWLVVSRATSVNGMLTKVQQIISAHTVGAEIREQLGLREYDEDAY